MTMINKLQSWKHSSANHLTKYFPIITCLYVVKNQENQFLVALKKLSKDCSFQTVTAEVYRDELVRDMFIHGLSSSYIRQRLLEHKILTQDEGYRYTVGLESPQKNSNDYNPASHIAAIHMATLDDDGAPEETVYDFVTTKINTKDSTLAATHISTNSKKKCGFCIGTLQSRPSCPTKEAECHHCGIVGHYSKVCYQRLRSSKPKKCTAALYKPSLLALPENLKNSATTCTIYGQNFSALIDSCSSDSYIIDEAANQLHITIQLCNQDLDLASTDKSVQIKG